ncbi:E3 ubiquitin-protein ligase WAV3 isoform X2 [Capsicum annuum]|uniref:E3 ubiquitin-protein ligase WAV3 isoform X2 n=1 Tax=Capsicum annuum TaxID=4072 RepID=UPI001FB0A70A|nr:E3 ubiquitin-protein ligase WAV3 isoform X2 [Capsicum annuum]
MVLGWRRAFCTSIPRDRDTKEKQDSTNPTPSPRISSKFGFFSNPSTPRFQSPPVSSSILRCRTTAAPPSTSTIQAASAPGSPKLQCKTKNSPRFFNSSTPSSPRSPSTFSLLKSSLGFPKTKCGTCLQTVKTGQGTAIFTAECSHSFHFPCIAALLRKQTALVCPVCHSEWKELPLLSIHDTQKPVKVEEKTIREVSPSPKAKRDVKFTNESSFQGRPILKVYNDDEPLMSPTSGARFNPIPESDEYDEEEDNVVEEFQGFFVDANVKPVKESLVNFTNFELRLLPEAAVVSVGRSHETYVIILKLKAPPALARTARRAPIDLVMVLDVSAKMKPQNIQMMKRAMRLVISSLSSSDRLSIVAFSTTSKRLLPLRRMTSSGKRSARRIVDAIVALDGTGTSASDALKKAAKVLEDRRERNPVASIMLLSDNPNQRSTATTTISTNQRYQSSIVSTCTRFNNLEIPVHSIGLNQSNEETFTKFIGRKLNFVVQDLKVQLGFVSGSAPAEVAAVYSYTNRPASLGSGSLRLGDFYAEEERELLVELKVPTSVIGAHHVLSVRCSYKDPSTEELVYCKEQALLVPRPHAVRSSTPNIQRLRDLFISTRAVAESRRMIERNDLTGAHHLLSSARALLIQSNSSSTREFLPGLETELSELHYKRHNQAQFQSQFQSQPQRPHRRRIDVQQREDDKAEPLTPTSAWRAAERLAKVAIMRKSLNRVSDLHGFEDARF